jgi:hypothetical protein
MFSDSTIVKRFGLINWQNVVLLIVNVVGASLYVWLTSYSWALPQEKGLNSTTSEPFLWAMAVVPTLGVALLIDVPWGIVILKRKNWSSGRLVLFVAVVWVVAIAIDFVHH